MKIFKVDFLYQTWNYWSNDHKNVKTVKVLAQNEDDAVKCLREEFGAGIEILNIEERKGLILDENH